MANWINTIPLIIIFTACLVLVSTGKPKITLVCMGVVYLGIFIISAQFTSVLSALIRLIVGLASILMIFFALSGQEFTSPRISRSGLLFRLMGYILFSLIAVFVSVKAESFLSFPIDIILAGLIVSFGGILVLGISGNPLKVILGILVFFCGFNAIYCSLETSILINGLLSVVNLVLGGIGAYFVIRDVAGREA